MDVATLGLEVRSDQVEKGTAALNKLSGAAKRAEAATTGVAGASKATSAANAAVSTSANSAAVALNREAISATKTSVALKAANSNVRRMSGSFSGLGAQFQDIGVTAAMGMNPMIIGLQQGTQMAGTMELAMQGGQSAVGALGAAFKSLLSPLTFITIGLTVLAAAGLQMVNWSGLAAAALNGLAWALQNLTPYILSVSAVMALLYAPAILSGLAAVTAAIVGMSVAAIRAAIAFTVAWLAALGPAGWFIIGLAAVTAAAIVFRDELTNIFGVDIVGVAKNAVNAIIGFFVGSFAAIVVAGENLPASFGDLAYRIADNFQMGITAMIRSTIASINGMIATINGKLGGIGINIPMLGGGKIGLNDDGTQYHIKNPHAGAQKASADAEKAAYAAAQGKDYVGAGIGAISNAASAGASSLRELAGSFTSVGDAAEKAGGKASGAAKKAIDPWKGLREVTDKTAEEIAKFDQGLAKGFLSTLRSGLAQGKSFLESFGDAAMNVLNKIADKLEDMFVESLFSTGGSGGGGGLFGALLGGIGSLFGFARGGYTGGGSSSSVAGVVHGGEYVFSKKATDRIGVGALDQLHGRAKGYASGGYVTPAPRITPAANQNVHVTVGVSVDKNGNLKPFVEDVSRQQATGVTKAGIAQYDKGMPGRIGEVMERHG